MLWSFSRLAPGAEAAPADGTSHPRGWSVETGSPDALCPDLGLTEAALRRRLGTVVTSGGVFRVRYTIGHAPQGSPRDFVQLELFGPDGGPQLSRELPLEGSCATMAEVIALVIDGHFRGLPHEEPEPLPVPTPSLATPSLALPVDAPTPAVAVAAEQTPRIPRLPPVLGAELVAQHPAGPSAGLRATTEIAPHVYLGSALALGLRSRSERLDGGAEVHARAVSLQLHGGLGSALGPVRAYVGPSLRFTLDHGAASGLPYDYAPGSRARFAPGAHAGALWRFHPRLVFMSSATLDWSLRALSGRFFVDGREVLEPSRPDLGFGVGLGYAFAP